MNEVTQILSAIAQGEPRAAEKLLPLVYQELRRLAAHRLAREAPGPEFQASDLLNEAYLRLVGEAAQPEIGLVEQVLPSRPAVLGEAETCRVRPIPVELQARNGQAIGDAPPVAVARVSNHDQFAPTGWRVRHLVRINMQDRNSWCPAAGQHGFFRAATGLTVRAVDLAARR